jgi:hypothetical protein
MTCLICAGPAEEVARQDHWEERKCPECGHYRIADAVVLTLMEQGQIFEVNKARAWLDENRSATRIPHLESTVGLLQD